MSVSCCLQSLRGKGDSQEQEGEAEHNNNNNNNNNNVDKVNRVVTNNIAGVSPDNASGSSGKSNISEHNADSGHPDSPDDDGLGPLPPHWEKAYTDKGEPYFIDHNTGEIFVMLERLHLVFLFYLTTCPLGVKNGPQKTVWVDGVFINGLVH